MIIYTYSDAKTIAEKNNVLKKYEAIAVLEEAEKKGRQCTFRDADGQHKPLTIEAIQTFDF